MSDIAAVPFWTPDSIVIEEVIASTNLLDFAEMPGRTLAVYCDERAPGEQVSLYVNEAEGTMLVVTSGGTFMEFKEVANNATRH